MVELRKIKKVENGLKSLKSCLIYCFQLFRLLIFTRHDVYDNDDSYSLFTKTDEGNK